MADGGFPRPTPPIRGSGGEIRHPLSLHSSAKGKGLCIRSTHPSPAHVAAWEQAYPEKRGVIIPIEKAMRWVDGTAAARYWSPDRGPDAVTGALLMADLRAKGVDVGVWE